MLRKSPCQVTLIFWQQFCLCFYVYDLQIELLAKICCNKLYVAKDGQGEHDITNDMPHTDLTASELLRLTHGTPAVGPNPE